MFKDPDFGPESKYNPIYFENDLDERTVIELDIQLKKLEWLRPKQIGPKPKLVGFTELNISNATPEELQELTQLYKVHGHRIIQGKLEDRWFLSALSMVAAEQKVFDQLMCKDEGF
jgi:hypothetical protein